MDIDTLTLPFRFGFMQNAFLISIIVSVPTALLSCFLVVKGWALMGDAVSHAVLPGIVLAYILGLPLIVGAFAAGMTCAVATGYLSSNSRIKQDTVMGVVFSGMFGLGIVMYVSIETNAHLDHILFGNMLGVDAAELWTAGLISLGVGLMLALKWRDWLLHSFDAAQARASGLRVNWLHYGMLAALSLTIVATLSAVGLILAIGLLIAPGAIAFLLVRTFGRMLWVSVVVCMVAMLSGSYLSFFLDSAPAPTIILILTAMFIAAFIRRQMVTRAMSTRNKEQESTV
ncbi:metal ABC transporter permease [Sulfitobacter sp. M57]|uniref:metal ABC transporter permease n=1 Tax=unclassified Sulfitobacter TaxID=196795 RepID=UPI0023E34985|nr:MULTISPECIES: metal ABC transporter permease [unclassified Sulfitobacter]MDF3414396.1 metal ABC transporter permease [Sulfitobacter sp. KE5]MDF3420322.1 metal ABC transporter permease [Sulfitobacter sp. KE43]MDF3432942.1 metal ABC transporter permease [Sulfitobacter sp. KE42]MDF3458582.1 metal ABC transporter permease [Sulfitobacter sp. S74]MDF3462482.1 metal ABC transporter permease [Sulfitobacter sp. Ks18]